MRALAFPPSRGQFNGRSGPDSARCSFALQGQASGGLGDNAALLMAGISSAGSGFGFGGPMMAVVVSAGKPGAADATYEHPFGVAIDAFRMARQTHLAQR
jgi:hypothetical protein